MGQGIATTLAQLVVDVFGVPIEKVRVVLGDTDRGDGFGSAGSRSLFTGGSALHMGVGEDAGHRRAALAAQALEAAPADLEYARGAFRSRAPTWASTCSSWPAGSRNSASSSTRTSAVAGPSWPNGCHISEVEIDPADRRGRGGRPMRSVNDVGRVVNPMIVRGQLDGGAVQGIGQALCEHMVYDREAASR